MVSHLQRDLTQLRQDILTMGGLVEAAVRDATEALVRREPELARKVINSDQHIDQMELQIDEECLKLLALHQPVASDLRFITAIMKINNDLERIADLAKNIAQRCLDLHDLPTLDEPLEFERMTETCRGMLRDALDALVERDSEAARRVVPRDDVVDELNRKHFAVIERRMKSDPSAVEAGLYYLSVSRNLERMADLATNLAEDVVFMVDAIDIRHWPLSRAHQYDAI